MNAMIQRGFRKAGVIAAVATASCLAMAQTALAAGPDMSGLTGAVDFGTVTVAVMAIAGLLAVVHVAFQGLLVERIKRKQRVVVGPFPQPPQFVGGLMELTVKIVHGGRLVAGYGR